MMKRAYRCLTNNSGYWLTQGKIYLVEKCVQSFKDENAKYLITNDKNFEHFIDDQDLNINFMDLEQWRNKQIESILYKTEHN